MKSCRKECYHVLLDISSKNWRFCFMIGYFPGNWSNFGEDVVYIYLREQCVTGYVIYFTFIWSRSRWWFQILFSPHVGALIQFDQYLSDGFKPPTSCIYIYIFMYIYKYICVNIHHIFLYTFGQILRNPILRHPPVFCVSPTKNRQNATSSFLSQGDGGCHERHCRVGSKAGHDFESQGMLGFQQQEKHHENRGYIHPPNRPFFDRVFHVFFSNPFLGYP